MDGAVDAADVAPTLIPVEEGSNPSTTSAAAPPPPPPPPPPLPPPGRGASDEAHVAPFDALHRLLSEDILTCSDSTNATLLEVLSVLRGWCSDTGADPAARGAVLSHITPLLTAATRQPTAPVLLCGISASATILSLQALTHPSPSDSLPAAATCLAAALGHATPPPSVLPPAPQLTSRAAAGREEGVPVLPRLLSVPSGAVAMSAAAAARQAVGDAGVVDRLFIHFAAAWEGCPEADGLALRIASSMGCTPGPLVSAALSLAVRSPESRSSPTLSALLHTAIGAPPSTEGMRRAIAAAHAWLLPAGGEGDVEATLPPTEGSVHHISHALAVLAAGIAASSEDPTGAVSIVNAAAGGVGDGGSPFPAVSPAQPSGPRKAWQQTFAEAMDHPSLSGRIDLACLGGDGTASPTPPPPPAYSELLAPAELDSLLSGEEVSGRRLYTTALRYALSAVETGPAVPGAGSVVAEALRCAVQLPPPPSPSSGGWRDALLRLVAALADPVHPHPHMAHPVPEHLSLLLRELGGVGGSPGPLQHPQEVLETLFEEHFTERRGEAAPTLKKCIAWPLLHIASVAVTRAGRGEAALGFLRNLWRSLCAAVSNGEDALPFDTPVTSFLHLAQSCFDTPELRVELSESLAASLMGCAGPRGNFAVEAQAVRLLHMALLSRENLPSTAASRSAELLSCPLREPTRAPVYPALLSPLRTSAVRSVLASMTGGGGGGGGGGDPPGAASPAPAPVSGNLYPTAGDFSPERVYSVEEVPPAVAELLPELSAACLSHSIPKALDADARQGLFDLSLATAHLMLGCPPPSGEAVPSTGSTPEGLSCLAVRRILHCGSEKGGDPQPLAELLETTSLLAGGGGGGGGGGAAAPPSWQSALHGVHAASILLGQWVEGRGDAFTAEDAGALTDPLARVVAILSGSHRCAVREVLGFLPEGSGDIGVVEACVEAGHDVRSSLLRLVIRHNDAVETQSDPSIAPADVVTAAGGSPKGRQFTALANARSNVDKLTPGDWHANLSDDADRLCAAGPPPAREYLLHIATRLASRPGQSASLSLTAAALSTTLPLLRRCVTLAGLGSPSGNPCPAPLMRALLNLSSAAPYQTLPLSPSGTVAEAASDVLGAILSQSGGVRPDALCVAWRLHKARTALQGAAEGGTPLQVLGGTLGGVVKWATTLPPLSGPLEEDPPQLGGVVSDPDPELDLALGDSGKVWWDTITACVVLMAKAGPSPFGSQLLTLGIAALEHPVGLQAECDVLQNLFDTTPEKVYPLVLGRAQQPQGDSDPQQAPSGSWEPCDASSFADLTKRWLCQVLASSEGLRDSCRARLLEGLPTCLRTTSALPYLRACAEVCSGGHERHLLESVADVLKSLEAEAGAETASGGGGGGGGAPLLPLLEFIKASLASILRVDGKGWFSQPAGALAGALSTLKFCNRSLRSAAAAAASGTPTRPASRYLPESLAAGPATNPFEQGYTCSFSQTKEEYSNMHWYLCYTAYPGERKGACGWCAEHLHRRRGFDVEYAGCIPAYCDTKGDPPEAEAGGDAVEGCGQPAGAGGAVSCGLSPHEAVDPCVLALFHPPAAAAPECQMSLPAEFVVAAEDIAAVGELLVLLERCVARCLPECGAELDKLAASSSVGRDTGMLGKGEQWTAQSCSKYLLHPDTALALEGVVDGRLEYDAMPHYEINLLQSRVLTRHVAAASLCGWVALVDRSQCLLIVDEAQSFPTCAGSPPRRGDSKAELCVLSRNTVRFKIIGMSVHPSNGVYLAVYGVHEVRVFVVSGGSIQSQLTPHLSLSSLSGSTHVTHCEWVPGSHTQLAVITTKFVKVFDLASDLYCPAHNYTLPEGSEFASAVFARSAKGETTMIAITSAGKLLSQSVVEGDCLDGPLLVTHQVDVPASAAGDSGCSLMYSHAMNTLCVGYTSGRAFVARWDFDTSSVEDILCIPSANADRPISSINHWAESPDAPGVLACILDDGTHVGLISLDKQKRLARVEVHELQGGAATHVEGIALARHRGVPGVPPPGTGRGGPRVKQPADTLNLVVTLESGTVCSYPLDAARTASLLQIQPLDQAQHDLVLQKSAVITAKPMRPKNRRPGGKASGRSDGDRDRDRDKDDAQEDPLCDGLFEALLHGKQLPRSAPFDSVAPGTLRAMLAFEAKWGGPQYTRSDIPTTVPLNVWEDLTPLGRGAWSITRGVGVAAEDRDKLADGLDTTCITITPLRALSRGPSVEPGGTSPPLRGLSGSPVTSPCNSPPLSPLSQRSSPPAVGLSPGIRAGDRRSPGVVPLGPPAVGDHRPAARFVLQASGDAVVCGLRLRLSCNAAKDAGQQAGAGSPGQSHSPPETVLSVVEDPVVMVRVASQTRVLACDTGPRWLGFVLTHREALKTPKSGVEVSIITNGPEVELRQVELFTSTAPPRSRTEELRSPEVPDKEQEIRERLRAREPTSPITAASSTLDAILQNLVGGRAAAVQRRRMEILEAREAAAVTPAVPPGQALQTLQTLHSPLVASAALSSPLSPVPPPAQPEEEVLGAHCILQSALDCMRLALSVSPAQLSEPVADSLWESVVRCVRLGGSGAAADRGAHASVAALHVLFANAGHSVSAYRKARALSLLKLLCRAKEADEVRLHLATLAAYATADFRADAAAWLRSEPDSLAALRSLADGVVADAQSFEQAHKGFFLTHERAVVVAHQLSVLDFLASRGDSDSAAKAMSRITDGLLSSPAASQAAVYVLRQLMSDDSLATDIYADIARHLLTLLDRALGEPDTQAAYFNSLVCMATKLAYPTASATQDLATFSEVVKALAPADLAPSAGRDAGLSLSQFLRLKSIGALAGASYTAPALQLPQAKPCSEAEARCVDVAKAIAEATAGIQGEVRKLAVAVLEGGAPLPDLDAQSQWAGGESLLPATPPVGEQMRVARDDAGDAGGALPAPPTPHDLIASTLQLTRPPEDCLQPLFGAVPQGSLAVVCKRHALVACVQLSVSLYVSGSLDAQDEWKATFDSALRRDDLRFISNDMKRVLTLCCGDSPDACQDYRDMVGLEREFAFLQDGAAAAAADRSCVETLLQGYSALEAMANIAVAHPRNWVRFCKQRGAVPFIVRLLQGGVPPELAAHALRLLAISARPSAEELEGVQQVVSVPFLLMVCEEHLLAALPEPISAVLSLGTPVGEARLEAAQLLKAVCSPAEEPVPCDNAVVVFDTLLQLLHRAASFGHAGTDTLLKLLLEVLEDIAVSAPSKLRSCITQLAASVGAASLRFTEALLRHPRAPTYLAIERVLGASKGHVLEGSWAQDCPAAQARLSEATLGALGADVKYSPDTIFVRLSSAIQLKRVMMLVSDCKLSKVPRELEVWHSSQHTPDARAVRDSEFAWQLLGRISVDNPAALCRATLELPLAVNTHALKLHFSSFHCDSAAQLSETLTCPSCNQVITDRHGQCLNCEYENAYQCRQCRNINHEQLDAFLCNECGWCRYGRVDFSLLCRQSLAPDIIRNESDRSRALRLLNEQNATAHQLSMQLADIRTTASHLALQMQLSVTPAGAPAAPAQPPPPVSKRELERKGPSEGVPEGLHPSTVALAAFCTTSAREINTHLAKTHRVQAALRKVIRAYAACGKTTSASADIHDELLSPTHNDPTRTEEAGECLLPTHFGALSQLCVQFIEAAAHLLHHDRDTVQEHLLKLGLLPALYSASLHAPEHVRVASRDLAVLLQEGSRPATESLVQLMLPHLLPAVSSPSACTVDAPHIHAAAALLSRCAGCNDGLWHLRLPFLLKVFLAATGQVSRHPALLEHVAKPALSLLTLLLTGEHTRTEGVTASAARCGRRWKAMWVLRRNPELREVSRGAEWLVQLLLSPAAPAVAAQVTTTALTLSTPPLQSQLLRVLTENLSRAAKESRGGGGCTKGKPGGGADPFFSLLATLLEPLWARAFLARKGFLTYVCKLLLREVYLLVALEAGGDATHGDGSIPVELGWAVLKLAETLALFVPAAKEGEAVQRQEPAQVFSRELKKGNGVAMLLDASLTLKSVAAVRTKPISSAESLIKGILDTLVTESNADRSSFISASVAYLAKARLPCQMGKHILEKVLSVVDPKPPEVVCQLLFKKKPSQEDFIRGSMGGHPVTSNTIGKTMGDVATRICRELDLQLDPDFGLELLVDSKIIDLSLPIQLVHDQVWKESQSFRLGGGSAVPMLVVYRLQGLDGEATEERIDKLEEPEVEVDDLCAKYAVTECLAVGGGLSTLVAYLASVGDILRNRADDTTLEYQLLVLVLSLLHHCCQVRANRVVLAQQMSLQVMLSVVDTCAGKEGDAANTALQLLLSAAGCIAGEMGACSAGDDVVDASADQHLEFCLEHLEQHRVAHEAHLKGVLSKQRTERKGLHKAEQHLYDVLRLVTALVRNNPPAAERISSYFAPYAIELADGSDKPEAVFSTQCFSFVIAGLDKATATVVREQVSATGLFDKVIATVAAAAAEPQKDAPSLPFVLRFIEALVLPGCEESEGTKAFDTAMVNAVAKLHILECKASKQDVTSAATDVLDAMVEQKADGGEVEKVRKQTKQNKHGAAMARRQKVLKKLKKKAPIAVDFIPDDTDDEGLCCLVCREAATFRPQDVLGFYMFARRVEIHTNTAPSDPHCVFASLSAPTRTTTYSCVTHSNAIHFSCHKDAVQIDASLRPPKREWDGATVRNLKTRCNAILPVRVADTNAPQYARCCTGFADRVGVVRGRGQLGLFEQSVYDIRMMVSRLSWGHSFTTDSNGGGPEHNFSVLPFLVQLSLHFMDGEGNAHERPRALSLVSQFVEGYATPFLFHIEGVAPPQISAEFVFYIVTVTLGVLSFAQWTERKGHVVRSLLAYLLSAHSTKGQGMSKPLQMVYADMQPPPPPATSAHAFLSGLVDRGRLDDYDEDGGDDSLEWVNMRTTTASSSSSAAASTPAQSHDLGTPEGVFAFLKPSLVFVCIIDALHTALKGDDASLEDTPGEASASAKWVHALNNRLEAEQLPMVEKMKAIRQRAVDQFLTASSLSELFEILGILPEVLSEAETAHQWAEQFLS